MQAAAPRITIITPNLNGAAYLEQTLRSVLSQGYANLEYIVVDGGSTDGSLDIVRRHADRLSFWCSESDGGQVAAINRGLRMATGEIVNWLNSDDILLPGALARIGEAFARSPRTEAICGWNIAFGSEGVIRHRIFPSPPPEIILSRRLLPQDAVYWRTSVTRRIGLLDESLKVRFDMDYWCRMVRAGVRFRLLPHFLSGFRLVPGQTSEVFAERGNEELARIVGERGGNWRVPRIGVCAWRLRRRLMHVMQRFGSRRFRLDLDLERYLASLAEDQTACS